MNNRPLAERMRPQSLDDYAGQKQLVGKGSVLRKMIDSGHVPSFILWGPLAGGEMHYDISSAFIKSIRGSDPDGAIYRMARRKDYFSRNHGLSSHQSQK